MSSRAAQLAIEIAERGASEAASGIGKATSAAEKLGSTVEAASKKADDGASRLDRAAGASDNLASKSSQATGGLGALASGLELVGLGPYAAGLQSAAMATDFFSGVGDIANLVLESQAIASARARVATIAQAAASKTAAVAQRVLNLAMSASPVLLIVAGVTLLVAAVVLAYKRSETFRRIVQAAMAGAKAAVAAVGKGFEALGALVGKVMGVIVRVVKLYVGVYVAAFKLGYQGAKEAWDAIQTAISRVVGWIQDHVGTLRDKLTGIWETIKQKGRAAFDALTAPIQHIIDLVQSLLDKISSIHIPHPDLNPFNGRASVPGAASASTETTTITIGPIVVEGTATADQADDLMDTIDRRLRARGLTPIFTGVA